jgi:eukaryotic-like serine/threonine-protein kinase
LNLDAGKPQIEPTGRTTGCRLRAGEQLGPYEVLEFQNRAGAAEMYRALDVRVDRIVRLKVFGEDGSGHKEALERIQLEAKALSLVSHPNLCRMYDFCDTRGYLFFVLEYVEGETLLKRLETAPMSVHDRLRIAIELSAAVQAVHGHGLLLGDLNTSNIVLTKFGAKLINFGPAVSVHRTGQTETAPIAGEAGDAVRCVAPEVIAGCATDRRSDIFSLGCVLIELLAGEGGKRPERAAFPPDGGATRSIESTASLRYLLDMCVVPDPERRWQSADDIQRQLRWALAEQSGVAQVSKKDNRKRRLEVAGAVLGLLAIAASSRYAVGRYARKESKGPRFKLSLPIVVAPGATQGVADGLFFAVSPDGKRIAMNATIGGKAGIWLESVENDELRMLDATAGMHRPFWSPDSSWVGFDSGQGIRITKIDGTTQPESVGDGLGTATWQGDTVLQAGDVPGALLKFSREGGGWKRASVKFAVPSPGAVSQPTFLPDGKAFLFLLRPSDREGALYAGRLGTDKTTKLLDGVASYALSGNHWLLYLRDRHLFARDLDFRSLRLGGTELKVADNIASFSSAPTGPIVCAPAPAGKDVEWNLYDRAGHRDVWSVDSDIEPAYYLADVSASPDGKSLAVVKKKLAGEQDIWVYSSSGGLRQITHGGESSPPVWGPDGKTIAYSAPGLSSFNDLYGVAASGEGEPTLLYRSEKDKYPLAWSQDSKSLLFESDVPPANHQPEIWALQLGTATVTPIVVGRGAATQARVSPDNRWLLYSFGERGSNVYVRGFRPGPSEPYLVSLNGGEQPSWGSDGKRIYYVSPAGTLMEVDFDGASGKPRLGQRRVAFPNVSVIHRNVVSEDANRYVLLDRDARVLVEQGPANAPLPDALTVLVNWLP